MPVAIALKMMHGGELWIFVASCVAIIPLAGLMGRATENLAETMGPGIGGLLNATFGNAAELIIALLRPAEGRRSTLVKARITGSIIGNILLVLGLAILLRRAVAHAADVQPHRRRHRRDAAGPGRRSACSSRRSSTTCRGRTADPEAATSLELPERGDRRSSCWSSTC